jgi:hypothetical protein
VVIGFHGDCTEQGIEFCVLWELSHGTLVLFKCVVIACETMFHSQNSHVR